MEWAAGDPWLLALALAATTLLLEDAAIAAGVALAASGAMAWPAALAAVAGGIAGGDLMLYGLGRASGRVPLLARRLPGPARLDPARERLRGHLGAAVLVARVVPGLRLAVYTAAGLLEVPFGHFAALVALAVAAWTGLLFWLGLAGGALADGLGLPPAAAAAALLALLAGLAFAARRWNGPRRGEPR